MANIRSSSTFFADVYRFPKWRSYLDYPANTMVYYQDSENAEYPSPQPRYFVSQEDVSAGENPLASSRKWGSLLYDSEFVVTRINEIFDNSENSIIDRLQDLETNEGDILTRLTNAEVAADHAIDSDYVSTIVGRATTSAVNSLMSNFLVSLEQTIVNGGNVVVEGGTGTGTLDSDWFYRQLAIGLKAAGQLDSDWVIRQASGEASFQGADSDWIINTLLAGATFVGLDSEWVLRQIPAALPNPYDSDWILRTIKRKAYDSEWALARFADLDSDLNQAKMFLTGADSDWVIQQIENANYNPAAVTDNYDFGTIKDPIDITLDLGLF